MNSNPIAVSTGAELADYAPAVAAAIANAHSPNTRIAYAQQFKAFCEWTAAAGVAELPASPAAVAAYLTTLAQQGTALASIRLAASAIAAAHIAQSLENPCASAGVKAALKGIGRSIGKPQAQAKPLTAEALGAIAQTAYIPRPRGRGLESAHIAERRGRIDIALCRTMSDAGLRISEAAALRWQDIAPAPDGIGGLVSVNRSKTDSDGAGELAYLTESTMIALDAIRYAAAADRLVFRLSPSAIHHRIRKAALAAGLGEGYSGHSGRVGLAVRMAAAPTSAVMRQGRWASPAQVARYQRGVSATAAAAYLS